MAVTVCERKQDMIVETTESIRERLDLELHLRVEKAQGYLRSYLTKKLNRVGFPCVGLQRELGKSSHTSYYLDKNIVHK